MPQRLMSLKYQDSGQCSYRTEIIPDSPILLLRQKQVSYGQAGRDRTDLDGVHGERTGRWPSQGYGDGHHAAIDSILITFCHTLPKLSRDNNAWLETKRSDLWQMTDLSIPTPAASVSSQRRSPESPRASASY